MFHQPRVGYHSWCWVSLLRPSMKIKLWSYYHYVNSSILVLKSYSSLYTYYSGYIAKLNFQSNHPLEHKRGVVKTLAYREKTVVSEREDRRKELDHLRGALKCNGYPEWILRDLREENNSESEKEVETSGETMSVKHQGKQCQWNIRGNNVSQTSGETMSVKHQGKQWKHQGKQCQWNIRGNNVSETSAETMETSGETTSVKERNFLSWPHT